MAFDACVTDIPVTFVVTKEVSDGFMTAGPQLAETIVAINRLPPSVHFKMLPESLKHS